MKSSINVKTLTITGLLSAIGLLIPMVFPKIVIGLASYTLASHVPIFIAMFISPLAGICVSIITTIGFYATGLPPEIALRAFSHIVFVVIGAFLLKKNNKLLLNKKSTILFASFISVIHGLSEVLAISLLYMTGLLTKEYTKNEFLYFVIVFIGIGTIIHSLIDFTIACFVWLPLQNTISIPANARIKLQPKNKI